jgi:hypothetical protein
MTSMIHTLQRSHRNGTKKMIVVSSDSAVCLLLTPSKEDFYKRGISMFNFFISSFNLAGI